MESTYGGFDLRFLQMALRGPGMDTRQWVSYGLVEKDMPDEEGGKSVVFTKEYGPIINVTLQPSGISVRCRVANHVAGNGEGEWYPFIPDDEVLVSVAGGNERNCIIIGRLNQEIDQFPTKVAGLDVDKNNFSFRRQRTPHVWEIAAGWLLINPVGGSYINMEGGGNITIQDAQKNFLHIGADFIGFQDVDGELLVQMNFTDKKIRLSADGGTTIFDIGVNSSFATSGTLALSGAGNVANVHATSIESVSSVLMAFTAALSAMVGTAALAAFPGDGGKAALLSLAGALVASGPTSALPGGVLVETALAAAVAQLLNPAYLGVLSGLLSAPTAPNGSKPGIGCVGIRVG